MKIQSNYTVLHITRVDMNTDVLNLHTDMTLIEEKAAQMGKAQTSFKEGRGIH